MAWLLLRSARIKQIGVVCGVIILLLALMIAATNWWVCHSAQGRIVSNWMQVPDNDIALVLGTSPKTGRGPNPFFIGRIHAAAQLFKSGKVKHLLVSGDNRRR